MSTKNPGRIQIHGQGVGEISEDDIEKRAKEIAADGRAQGGQGSRPGTRAGRIAESLACTGPGGG